MELPRDNIYNSPANAYLCIFAEVKPVPTDVLKPAKRNFSH